MLHLLKIVSFLSSVARFFENFSVLRIAYTFNFLLSFTVHRICRLQTISFNLLNQLFTNICYSIDDD